MKRREKRSMKGFTLIELLVVVIIIGILAAIALPNFIGVEAKAREASVKANMRTIQIASESYATDNGGTYDASIDTGFVTYLPGGSSDGTTTAGHYPVNPFTNTGASADYAISLALQGTVPATRTVAGSGITLGSPGQIAYGPGDTASTTYAVMGVGAAGTAIAGQASPSTLVLSNE